MQFQQKPFVFFLGLSVFLLLILCQGSLGQGQGQNGQARKGKAKVQPVKGAQPSQQELFPEDSHSKGFFQNLNTDSAAAALDPLPTDYTKISPSIRNNGNLPYKTRFGVRERLSNNFHYSILPAQYWAIHKRPDVPLIEETENNPAFSSEYE